MEKGWNAEGLLRPLWQRYPGKRDGLARDVGSTGSTLSAINTGRQALGFRLGTRLADALDVSLLELGAPEGASDAAGQTLVTRLELLATDLAESARAQADLADRLRRLEGRLRKHEARPSHGEDRSKDQAK